MTPATASPLRTWPERHERHEQVDHDTPANRPRCQQRRDRNPRGCAALTDDEAEQALTFDQLQRTTVYVDEAVELAMPADVPTASTTENADLVVLPGDPAIGAPPAVNWLAEERSPALVGSACEATWLDWAQSDPFSETFGPGGYVEGEPDPLLLVAAEIGETVPTYRHSWSNTPRDRGLLRALDEDLAEIANRPPS